MLKRVCAFTCIDKGENALKERPSGFCRLAMKESKGRMNPGVMNKLLAQKLKG